MIGYTIHASDGELGKVQDFYFDDASWIIRYMVVETGNWLSGRKVLISLAAFGKPDVAAGLFSVNLTCEQVKNSPDIDTQKPVFRQHELKLHEYYQWPLYWNGGKGGILGATPYPVLKAADPKDSLEEPEKKDDPQLRSTRHMANYHIHATDGEIGYVEDFIFDEANWTLSYLIVDTSSWFIGKMVLVPRAWIKSIVWIEARVHIDRVREAVKKCLVYDPLNTEYPHNESA